MKIVDGRFSRAYLLPEQVTPEGMSLLFQSGSLVAIGSAAAVVSFPVAYGQVPTVVATPGATATRLNVNAVTQTGFTWQADIAGTASWQAIGVK
ncbi:MAG: hypothetical protein WC551_07930 [Patescibacteria group bacterium]